MSGFELMKCNASLTKKVVEFEMKNLLALFSSERFPAICSTDYINVV